MHLVLVRHGATTAHPGCCVGQTDVPLSDLGVRDIADLAMSWDTQTLMAPGRILASDLVRAAASAAPFASRFGLGVVLDRRLRELTFGEWDGREWSDIERDDAVRYRDWADHWAERAPPGGERVAQLVDRARSFLDELAASSEHRDDTLLVVAHAGWIRAALALLLGEPPSEMLARPVDYARAFIVVQGRGSHAGSPRHELIAANVQRIEI